MINIREERKGLLFGRLFYAWVIVFVAWLILFFCTSTQMGSFPVFYSELLDYFGWTRGALGLGLTLNMVFVAVFGPLAGVIMNRIGPRRVVMIGAAIAVTILYKPIKIV